MNEETRKMLNWASNTMIALLATIAVCVVISLFREGNTWELVVVYWFVLSVKNIIDYIAKF